MKLFFSTLLVTLFFLQGRSQSILVNTSMELSKDLMPEHGFLPGKKFAFYPTLEKYDFKGKKFRVELYDQRDSLQLMHVACSEVEINNKSEFAGPGGAGKVVEYFRNLLPASGITLDSTATETIKVNLEALDSRIIGFGSGTAHGLCQMHITCPGISQSYCVDITDKDKHSPVGKNAFVTRKTATRIIQSASIREVIEKFLADLQNAQKLP
ncbi:hypothetical protein ACX0G9_21785 [Flavitalea flava]